MITPAASSQESVCWSVSALVHAVADTLKMRFSAIAVRGEISNFSRATSGHCYFTLKDESSQIRCAMFQRAASMLSFQPANGNEVELRGRLAIYEQRGELQLIVEAMSPVGQGRLLEQFQQLKTKLGHEGLFDAARKQTPPAYPQTLGVVSSLQAAALHDVLTALKRRAPHVRIIIYPTAVQGVQAVGEIVSAIGQASKRKEVDTLLICRGGGSLEDLWCFNEEAVVRAIAKCTIPVISGVGHETDFTLTDFVADVRAPTPTAAAELAAQPQQALLESIEQNALQLKRQLNRLLERHAQRLDRATMALRQPAYTLRSYTQKLEHTELLLNRSMMQGVRQRSQALRDIEGRWQRQTPAVALHMFEQKVAQLSSRFQWHTQQQLKTQKLSLSNLSTRLAALNPAQVLSRGYAWVTDEKGHVVSSATQLQPEQALQAQFADGKALVKVKQVMPDLLQAKDE